MLLPKLKFIELSKYVMDLLMVSEGSDEHVKEPNVRNIWHLFSLRVNTPRLAAY
jgi:hypothetical protein